MAGPSWGAPGAAGRSAAAPATATSPPPRWAPASPGPPGPVASRPGARWWSRAGRWACSPCAGPPGGRSPAGPGRGAAGHRCRPGHRPAALPAAVVAARAGRRRLPAPALCRRPAHHLLGRAAAGRGAGQAWTRSSWPTPPPSAPWPAPSRPRTPTPAATCRQVTAYGNEACRALGGDLAATPAWSTHSSSTTWARSACRMQC